MAGVFVLGSLNVDTSYYLQKLPEPGMTVPAGKREKAAGGKGLNQAAAACITGAAVSLIGAVGEDEDGRFILDAVREYPINTDYLTETEMPTGTAVILVDEDGANMIAVHGGANRHVPVEDVSFREGDWLATQLETDACTVRSYFEMAKEKGAYTMLNLSPYEVLDKRILELTDLLVVNEHEASQFLGVQIRCADQARQAGRAMSLRGIKNAVITLGSDGAVVLEGGESRHIQGRRVKAVDTQGAGDAFAGILAGELALGKTLMESAEYANNAAAECVKVYGSTLVSLRELENRKAAESSRGGRNGGYR